MNLRWIPLLTLLPTLHAGTLYYTDFENFPVGPNNWSGTDGWLASDNGSGAQAIDLDVFPAIALGKSATLGNAPPNGPEVVVAKFFNYDHTATGLAGIEINSFVAIADSTNSHRDDFFIAIFNKEGTRLASIRFDNDSPDDALSEFGIWRQDGILQFDTGVEFTHEELLDLYIEIDLSANTWSADIFGFPLFTDANFTSVATGSDINFGSVAYEWVLTSGDPTDYGDNLLVIDELTVRSYPIGVNPFTVTGTRDPGTGEVTLSWHGDFGFDYQVQFSSDLVDWFDTLPGSTFLDVTNAGPMSYTDTTTTGAEVYYRVVRSEAQ